MKSRHENASFASAAATMMLGSIQDATTNDTITLMEHFYVEDIAGLMAQLTVNQQ